MPATTPRMAIPKPLGTDAYGPHTWGDAFDILDQFPGTYICTSGTRPLWGVDQVGMFIFETDTSLVYRWTGASFVRPGPLGLLGDAVADSAVALTATYATVASLNYNRPAGGRSIEYRVNVPRVTGLGGGSEIEWRVNDTVTQIGWYSLGSGSTAIVLDDPVATGATSVALEARTTGGTASVAADAAHPLQFSAHEV